MGLPGQSLGLQASCNMVELPPGNWPSQSPGARWPGQPADFPGQRLPDRWGEAPRHQAFPALFFPSWEGEGPLSHFCHQLKYFSLRSKRKWHRSGGQLDGVCLREAELTVGSQVPGARGAKPAARPPCALQHSSEMPSAGLRPGGGVQLCATLPARALQAPVGARLCARRCAKCQGEAKER